MACLSRRQPLRGVDHRRNCPALRVLGLTNSVMLLLLAAVLAAYRFGPGPGTFAAIGSVLCFDFFTIVKMLDVPSSDRGLSPHKFMPMPGVHQPMERTPTCCAPRRRSSARWIALGQHVI